MDLSNHFPRSGVTLTLRLSEGIAILALGFLPFVPATK